LKQENQKSFQEKMDTEKQNRSEQERKRFKDKKERKILIEQDRQLALKMVRKEEEKRIESWKIWNMKNKNI